MAGARGDRFGHFCLVSVGARLFLLILFPARSAQARIGKCGRGRNRFKCFLSLLFRSVMERPRTMLDHGSANNLNGSKYIRLLVLTGAQSASGRAFGSARFCAVTQYMRVVRGSLHVEGDISASTHKRCH